MNLALVSLVLASTGFRAEIAPLSEDRIQVMRGTTWRPGCPVDLDTLRQITLRHHGFEGEVHEGVLIVHADLAEDVVQVFRALFELAYPIQRVRPASDFGGDDRRSMAANNTSAFNCRPITGRRSGFSLHAHGRAIDLNPLYNPYVKGERVAPAGGRPWLDRSRSHPALLVPESPAVRAFTNRGFRWGGGWKSLKDYQHFERPRVR